MSKLDIVLVALIIFLGASVIYLQNQQINDRKTERIWMSGVEIAHSQWQDCYDTAWKNLDVRKGPTEYELQLQNDLEICSQLYSFPKTPSF